MMTKMANLGGLGILHRYMKVSDTFNRIEEFRKWPDPFFDYVVAVGSLANDLRRIDMVLENIKAHDCGHLHICVDIAHGHSKNMMETLKYIQEIRKKYLLTFTLIAGNVCTSQGTRDLVDWGADVVKVGVGPGSACTTRIKTGCGFPQLQAIENCAPHGTIIADGGIKTSGDAAKALAFGAEAVMIGGMLAGTDCVPGYGRAVELGDSVAFRGMASKDARKDSGAAAFNAEGIATRVPTKPIGSTQNVVEELCEGIRSAMSYTGNRTLKEFRQRAGVIDVSPTVIKENLPHIL
jgi:IMP dehydrogenase